MAVKRILSIGVDKDAITEHIESGEYAVEMAPTPRSALVILTEVRFDLIVVAHPLEDITLRFFLDEVRDKKSSSRIAKVLVLAEDTEHEELGRLRERSLEIVSTERSELAQLTSKALGGDPRFPLAVMVRLDASLPYGRSMRICQSENLSISGMLLRTEETLPVGTEVFVSFTLPGEKAAIETNASVVRLTVPGEIPGIALSFLGIKDRDHDRLEEFLDHMEG